MEVEEFNLISITIGNNEWENRELRFKDAKLMLVTQYGDKLWYVDVAELDDAEVLDWLSQNENIRVTFVAVADNGERLQGAAYAHPNAAHRGLAIRGEGELSRL
ncbi:hypothetical protein B1748_05525 [Paenibacillus sp. MY03]|uniref:hypothetical protein n=1 Tax=Paenibacillus sp. MY03 TaxID=302980 RepID=UPI000B3C6236|nr:hypothetical protein [Paenibacillus sp. MY03]OUS78217.1 hypothetical protein B1748_05525 [Paenibacillus sp. MY03]